MRAVKGASHFYRTHVTTIFSSSSYSSPGGDKQFAGQNCPRKSFPSWQEGEQPTGDDDDDDDDQDHDDDDDDDYNDDNNGDGLVGEGANV